MPFKVRLLPSAKEFLDKLPQKFWAKAVRSISLLEEFGPGLREPHSKKVSGWDGLFELRVQLGNNICRLFYFSHRLSFYIVTSGYIKKSMKLDRNELARAASLMRQYLEEKGSSHEDI